MHYEATRAGLDPQLVLGVIHHESGFKKYAVSIADARGYMQVMPFWTKLIGGAEHNLFHLRTNLRYGCVILRHYLDRENGDLFRALGRYNGSLGRSRVSDRRARRDEPLHWLYAAARLSVRDARRHRSGRPRTRRGDVAASACRCRAARTAAASRPRPPARCTSAR